MRTAPKPNRSKHPAQSLWLPKNLPSRSLSQKLSAEGVKISKKVSPTLALFQFTPSADTSKESQPSLKWLLSQATSSTETSPRSTRTGTSSQRPYTRRPLSESWTSTRAQWQTTSCRYQRALTLWFCGSIATRKAKTSASKSSMSARGTSPK